MESKQYAIEDIDPYSTINKNDYVPNYLGFDKLGPVLIICGQSMSGKSVVLNNMLQKKLIHEYKPEDIHIFSKTVKGDLTYKPVLKYIVDKGKKPNIYNTVDFKIINDIVAKQEKVGINQMYAKTKEDEPKLKKILFIFDDMLSDKGFKSHTSQFATFATLCRHYGIS